MHIERKSTRRTILRALERILEKIVALKKNNDETIVLVPGSRVEENFKKYQSYFSESYHHESDEPYGFHLIFDPFPRNYSVNIVLCITFLGEDDAVLSFTDIGSNNQALVKKLFDHLDQCISRFYDLEMNEDEISYTVDLLWDEAYEVLYEFIKKTKQSSLI